MAVARRSGDTRKRGPDAPPKRKYVRRNPPPVAASTLTTPDGQPIKRKRGRPPKIRPPPEDGSAAASTATQTSADASPSASTAIGGTQSSTPASETLAPRQKRPYRRRVPTAAGTAAQQRRTSARATAAARGTARPRKYSVRSRRPQAEAESASDSDGDNEESRSRRSSSGAKRSDDDGGGTRTGRRPYRRRAARRSVATTATTTRSNSVASTDSSRSASSSGSDSGGTSASVSVISRTGSAAHDNGGGETATVTAHRRRRAAAVAEVAARQMRPYRTRGSQRTSGSTSEVVSPVAPTTASALHSSAGFGADGAAGVHTAGSKGQGTGEDNAAASSPFRYTLNTYVASADEPAEKEWFDSADPRVRRQQKKMRCVAHEVDRLTTVVNGLFRENLTRTSFSVSDDHLQFYGNAASVATPSSPHDASSSAPAVGGGGAAKPHQATEEETHSPYFGLVSHWRLKHASTVSFLLSHPYAFLAYPFVSLYNPSLSHLELRRSDGKNASAVNRYTDSAAAPSFSSCTSASSAALPHPLARMIRNYQNSIRSVSLPIIVGGTVRFTCPENRHKSHQWTVYVRGIHNGFPHRLSPSGGVGSAASAASSPTSVSINGGAAPQECNDYLSNFISHVDFVLDKSFTPHTRRVTQAPFEIAEVGWGEFTVVMHVFLKNFRETAVHYTAQVAVGPGGVCVKKKEGEAGAMRSGTAAEAQSSTISNSGGSSGVGAGSTQEASLPSGFVRTVQRQLRLDESSTLSEPLPAALKIKTENEEADSRPGDKEDAALGKHAVAEALAERRLKRVGVNRYFFHKSRRPCDLERSLVISRTFYKAHYAALTKPATGGGGAGRPGRGANLHHRSNSHATTAGTPTAPATSGNNATAFPTTPLTPTAASGFPTTASGRADDNVGSGASATPGDGSALAQPPPPPDVLTDSLEQINKVHALRILLYRGPFLNPFSRVCDDFYRCGLPFATHHRSNWRRLSKQRRSSGHERRQQGGNASDSKRGVKREGVSGPVANNTRQSIPSSTAPLDENSTDSVQVLSPPPPEEQHNVVVLRHLLRFSHRPYNRPLLPPFGDRRGRLRPGHHHHNSKGGPPEFETTNENPGYLLVDPPVVTESYDEIVIPLNYYQRHQSDADSDSAEDTSDDDDDDSVMGEVSGGVSGGEDSDNLNSSSGAPQYPSIFPAIAALETSLRMSFQTLLLQHVKATNELLYRNVTDSTTNARFGAAGAAPGLLPGLSGGCTNRGGVRFWGDYHVLYGDVIKKDFIHTLTYLRSIGEQLAGQDCSEEYYHSCACQEGRPTQLSEALACCHAFLFPESVSAAATSAPTEGAPVPGTNGSGARSVVTMTSELCVPMLTVLEFSIIKELFSVFEVAAAAAAPRRCCDDDGGRENEEWRCGVPGDHNHSDEDLLTVEEVLLPLFTQVLLPRSTHVDEAILLLLNHLLTEKCRATNAGLLDELRKAVVPRAGAGGNNSSSNTGGAVAGSSTSTAAENHRVTGSSLFQNPLAVAAVADTSASAAPAHHHHTFNDLLFTTTPLSLLFYLYQIPGADTAASGEPPTPLPVGAKHHGFQKGMSWTSRWKGLHPALCRSETPTAVQTACTAALLFPSLVANSTSLSAKTVKSAAASDTAGAAAAGGNSSSTIGVTGDANNSNNDLVFDNGQPVSTFGAEEDLALLNTITETLERCIAEMTDELRRREVVSLL